MKLLWIICLWLAGAHFAPACPAQVILLRHAEKPADESDSRLSEKGRLRAEALAGWITNTPAVVAKGFPAAIFASKPSARGHSGRASETVQPMAERLNLPLRTPFRPADYRAMAEHVLSDPEFDDKTVVICWVHDYLPELAHALGVKPKPKEWDSDVFDRAWIITYGKKGATLKSIRQKLYLGDAKE